MIYSSPAYEGALLEQLVHAGIGRLPADRVASRIVLPDDCEVPAMNVGEHPDWYDEVRSREIGKSWVESETSLALLVPSFAAQPWGLNALLNPGHPQFDRVVVAELVEIAWDPRVM